MRAKLGVVHGASGKHPLWQQQPWRCCARSESWRGTTATGHACAGSTSTPGHSRPRRHRRPGVEADVD
jgi:hypothetical protein